MKIGKNGGHVIKKMNTDGLIINGWKGIGMNCVSFTKPDKKSKKIKKHLILDIHPIDEIGNNFSRVRIYYVVLAYTDFPFSHDIWRKPFATELQAEEFIMKYIKRH